MARSSSSPASVDLRPDHAAILTVAVLPDQLEAFQPRQQARDVGLGRDHAFADGRAGQPLGCAPRRMRSTLYWVEVRPQPRIFCWKARCRQSEVRSRFRNASSSALEKGGFCAISDFRLAIGNPPSDCRSGPERVAGRASPLRGMQDSERGQQGRIHLLLRGVDLDGERHFVAHHRCGHFGANAEGRSADGRRGRKSDVRLVVHALNRPAGPSTSKATGLVTPCNVKLPVTVSLLPFLATPVLVKVAVGKLATSK